MKMHNIEDFGARSDGEICTSALQRAIDACGAGEAVYIPEGVFVSGAVYLKSNMTLYIEKGGTLLGSTDTDDYPVMKYRFEGTEQDCYASLINTMDGEHENITIEGAGTINANGALLRQAELKEKKGKPGRAVCLRNCKNVVIKDVTVRQSPAWCVHIVYSENVTVDSVKIHTKYDENGNKYKDIVNGDGLDIDSCRYVTVTNSLIASQDDCIAIKSGKDAEGRAVGIPSENIKINNCTLCDGFGVAIGSEMSGGVRNVYVNDCTFENTHSIAAVKAPRGRGGRIENIHYDGCVMKNAAGDHRDCEWFRGGLYVDNFYSHVTFDPDIAEEINDGTPVMDGIYFKNIELDTIGGNAVYLCGLPESPLENIYFENVRARGTRGITVMNTKSVEMKNTVITAESAEKIKADIEL